MGTAAGWSMEAANGKPAIHAIAETGATSFRGESASGATAAPAFFGRKPASRRKTIPECSTATLKNATTVSERPAPFFGTAAAFQGPREPADPSVSSEPAKEFRRQKCSETGKPAQRLRTGKGQKIGLLPGI